MASIGKINYLMLLIFLLAISSCKLQVNVCDDFDTSKLSKIWRTDRMAANSLELQTKIVRKGSGAAKITLHAGDVFEAGIGKSKNSERDELQEIKKLESVEEKKYQYSFSLFLPGSFPIVPVRLVIAQWKQHCGDNADCADDSPVLALRYTSGKFSIVMQTDSGKTKLYETYADIRNKWLDFKFIIHFSRLSNGSTEAWLNHEHIISYHGITCYSSNKGYTNPGHFYFKTGLYRDVMKEPMTIYIDEYCKKELMQ